MSNTDTLTSWLEGGTTGGVGAVQDWNNLNGERSLSSQDISQRLVASYVVDLPFGHGKKFLTGMSGFSNAAGLRLGLGWHHHLPARLPRKDQLGRRRCPHPGRSVASVLFVPTTSPVATRGVGGSSFSKTSRNTGSTPRASRRPAETMATISTPEQSLDLRQRTPRRCYAPATRRSEFRLRGVQADHNLWAD